MTDSIGRPGPRVLLVEDNPGDAHLVKETLGDPRGGDGLVEEVQTLSGALTALEDRDFDVVLLDLNLPDSTGLGTLEAARAAAPDVALVVLTGLTEEELGVRAVRAGAHDFLRKDQITGALLHRTLRHAMARARTGSELRRSRDRFRAIFEAGPYGLLVFDQEGVIRQANARAAALFGYRQDELLGMNVEVLVPEAARPHWLKAVGRPLEDPSAAPAGDEVGEARGRREDGSEFVVHLSLSPFQERDELRILAVVEDVTKRVEKEERIRFQAELLGAVGQAVVATDPDGSVTYWNRAAEELYGWTREEALGRPIVDLTVSEPTREGAEEILEEVSGGRSWTGEFEVRRKDGTTFPALVANAPILDQEGRVAGIIGISSDISERVRAEEQLARSNRALRVLSRANEAVYSSSGEDELLDHVCRIAVEEGGYRFAWIGYAQHDQGRTVRPVASYGVDEGYLDAVKITWSDDDLGRGPTGTAIRTGEPSLAREIAEESGFAPWRDEALSRRYRSSVAIPLLTAGECLGALNIYSGETDAFDELEIEVLGDLGTALAQGITLHRARRREDELHSRLQGAENLRALGQLATGVAHDFNNYLTVITSVADLLLADSSLDERHRGDIREIREAADQSAVLTSQLLAFGRKHPTRLEVVDLNRAVRGTASMLDRILGENITVEMSLAPEIGPIRVDPVQLEQALMNLVLNARDAMPDGGTLTIRTAEEKVGEDLASRYESVKAGPHVLLEITDSGVGMDPETRARLFEPFFTKKEGGTGLGLSMVYGSVKQSGGSIWVDSEPGKGTTFRIYLPVAEQVGEERTPARPGAGPGPLHGSETILLVEDQAAVRRATCRILERYGYEVIEASSVAEARQAIRSRDGPLHLVVTDMNLRDGSGRDVADALLDAGSGVPVLFTSGVAPEDLDAGPTFDPTDHYIEKPFDPDGLAQAVRAALIQPDAGLGEAG